MPLSKLPQAPPQYWTVPRRRTFWRCCKDRPTVKFVNLDTWEFWGAGRTCTNGCPSYAFFNQGPLLTPTLRGRLQDRNYPRLATNASKTIVVATKAAPVLFRFNFNPNKPKLSPPVTTNGTGGIAPPAGACYSLAAHTLTKTAAPKSATPMAIGSGKKNSNGVRPTEVLSTTPRPTTNPDSDIPLAGISVERYGNSYYVKLHKNFPAR